jgi:hypothetical protein
MLPAKIQNFDEYPNEALISIGTACALTDRSSSSFYRAFNSGELTPIKLGKSTRIRVGDLRALMTGGAA